MLSIKLCKYGEVVEVVDYFTQLSFSNILKNASVNYKGSYDYILSFITDKSKCVYLIRKEDKIIGLLLINSGKRTTHHLFEVWDEFFYLTPEYHTLDIVNKLKRLMIDFSAKCESSKIDSKVVYFSYMLLRKKYGIADVFNKRDLDKNQHFEWISMN